MQLVVDDFTPGINYNSLGDNLQEQSLIFFLQARIKMEDLSVRPLFYVISFYTFFHLF